MATVEIVSEIYSTFLDLLPLLDEDRKHLKEVRGLSDELIDEWRFRSAGKHVTAAIEEMKKRFTESQLIDTALLQGKDGVALIDPSLFSERIIIPYRYGDGKGVTLIRPHKLGLKGLAPQVFCEHLLKDRPKKVVITEGEFKTLALHVMGIPSISVPGVSSLSGRYLDKLVSLLQQYGVEHAIISFDNDEKDNPMLRDKFKPPNKRYDTEFYAYIMASQLAENGIASSIAPLPNEWRIDGKADIDSAWVQLGKTRDDFMTLFSASQSPADYLKNLPDTAQRVVKRKVTAWKSYLPIKRKLGRYVIEKKLKENEGGGVIEIPITNFVLNIKQVYESAGEVSRLVEFENEYGERSEPFILRPEEMGADAFRKFCLSKGNYLFKGAGTRELNMILEYEFMESPAIPVQLPRAIGEIKPGVWLFGNCAVHDGKIYEMGEDGIAWVDEKQGDEVVQIGYKPQTLAQDIEGDAIDGALPMLSMRDVDFDIKEVGEKLAHAYGGMDAYLGLGWVLASLFSRDIFREYKLFPFLFLRGKRRSGKTTYTRFLMQFFGNDQDGLNLPDATIPGIIRPLGYYTSLGVWFDEYRNDQRVTQKDGLFRTAYNRQSVGRGVKSAFGMIQYPVRATICMSGQESPMDNALLTRCVILNLTEGKLNGENLPWLTKNSYFFSALTRDILRHYSVWCPKVIQNILRVQNLFEEDASIDFRTAANWGIFIGALITFIPEIEEEIIPWAIKHCVNVIESGESSDELSQFYNALSVMLVDGDINDGYVRYDIANNQIYIWLTGCFSKFAEVQRRQSGRSAFDRGTIQSYLRSEAYVLPDRLTKRMGGESRSVYAIDASQITPADHALSELLESLKGKADTSGQPEF